MLLVVNPAASGYSVRLEAAVARELGRSFSVELVRTEEPGHAIPISRTGAGDGGLAAVAVLGGDGAVNEVANGLVGSALPLLPLPGGRTNVLCRALGLPRDARGAAAIVAGRAERIAVRRVDLGTMNGRAFTFASGIGLSARANRRLSSRGTPGRRLGGRLFVYEGLAVAKGYLRRPPRLSVSVGDGGEEIQGTSVIAQNADPLTYLGSRPLPLCEGAGLESQTISLAVLRRVSLRTVLALAPRLVLGRGDEVIRDRDVASVPRVREVRVRTLDGRPLPVEVDGDYVGELDEVSYGVLPGVLSVIAGRGAA